MVTNSNNALMSLHEGKLSRHKLLMQLLSIGTILLLAGCSFDDPARRIPTAGPLQKMTGEKNIDIVFSASTNCVEIGENIVFTLRITNATTSTLILSNTLDIVLIPDKPVTNTPPSLRWSHTDQYPNLGSINIESGETRVYTWTWQSNTALIADSITDSTNIRAEADLALKFPNYPIPQRYGPFLSFGVGYLTFGQATVPCAEVRRQQSSNP